MADEPVRGRRRTAAPEPPNDAADPEGGQEQLFGDLSGIAREAVRSPADPRLDAHLAFLGLGDGPAPGTVAATTADTTAPQAGDPGRDALQSEVDQLRASVARLHTTATQTSDRIRQLTFVIGVLAIATVVALIIGIVR